nr:Mur ligase family protein [uncultured Duganella sp.]
MKVLQQRLLRGANLYHRLPCLTATIDTGVAVPPEQLAAGLARQWPGAAPWPAPPHADVGQLVASLALALQQACGHALDFAHAEPVGPNPGLAPAVGERRAVGRVVHRIVVRYALEHVAQRALATALEMVAAAARTDAAEPAYDGPGALAALRALAAALALPPRVADLVAQAHARGIPVLRVSEHADLVQFGWGSRQWRFVDAPLDDTPLLTNTVVRDRLLTRALLVEANIDVPAGTTVGRLEDALRVGRRYDWKVVVRQRHAGGADRQWLCRGEAELAAAFALARAAGDDVVLECFEDGPLAVVPVGPGGALHGSAALRRLCEGAAAKLGLAEARVGVVESEIGALVTTIEAGPGGADVVDAASRARRMLSEAGQGRIPVIAVTGTNGKTTTTLMIAHAVRLAGLRVGCATTQGIVIGERLAGEDDCTGYWSHRTVLGSPEVDFAVLETARGGLLKRGLAFDACAVGVLLNVSDDHLGLDGVATVEDLARVKSTVVAAARTAVLNADDRHCVAAVRHLRADAGAILFSMEADNPILRAHMQQGGGGVWLERGAIMLADGADARARAVIDAADIPATVGGLARHNIANSLAAAAALHASGFGAAHIGAALSSFVSDATTNPLRANIFQVRDFQIVLDYAHNPAAYAALGELARAMAARGGGGRVLAVVTSPGDRRDADLRHIGATCAGVFDALFVYESQGRGRPPGQAAALIADGARMGGAGDIETYGSAAPAVRGAFGSCRAGDVLVFACGTAVSTLVDAVRGIDPEAAAAIARQ